MRSIKTLLLLSDSQVLVFIFMSQAVVMPLSDCMSQMQVHVLDRSIGTYVLASVQVDRPTYQQVEIMSCFLRHLLLVDSFSEW